MRDFLKLTPDPVYDRVVMNPPFDAELDIEHVQHAMGFLAEDGMLAAIMSAGTEYRETARARTFRNDMATLNAEWSDLPQGSFSEVGDQHQHHRRHGMEERTAPPPRLVGPKKGRNR